MLQKELEKFNNIKRSLSGHAEAACVVIKGESVLGVFDNRDQALRKGLEAYGNVPFLVKQVSEGQRAINFIAKA